MEVPLLATFGYWTTSDGAMSVHYSQLSHFGLHEAAVPRECMIAGIQTARSTPSLSGRLCRLGQPDFPLETILEFAVAKLQGPREPISNMGTFLVVGSPRLHCRDLACKGVTECATS